MKFEIFNFLIIENNSKIFQVKSKKYNDPSTKNYRCCPQLTAGRIKSKILGSLKGQLQGHTTMLAARQERGERGK